MQEGSGYGQYGYGPAAGGALQSPGYPGGYWQPGPPRPPRRGGLLTYLLVAVLAACVGAGLTLAVYRPSAGPAAAAPPLPGASAVPSPPAPAARGGGAAPASEQQVVNKVEPALVVINTALQYSSAAAAGTGMVINPHGLILTNNHVIENATKITATVISSGRTYPAKVVGYQKAGDIALLQLQGASGLPSIPVGNSATVRTGDAVVALGNAEGQGTIIPAAGRITALNKTITAGDQGGSVSSETLHGMIQTNAGIVSGDSGGPLVNRAGQVIGMNTANNGGISLSPGQAPVTAFAIPINKALSVARQIAAGHGSATIRIGYPPFIGIFIASGSSASPQAQANQQQGQNGFGGFGGFGGPGTPGGAPACYSSNANLGVPSSIAPVSSGTLVDGTICGSPAAAAGMTAGSVITAVNGQPAGAPSHLTAMLAKFRPGDTISVSWVSPGGQHHTSRLHLLPGPPQ